MNPIKYEIYKLIDNNDLKGLENILSKNIVSDELNKYFDLGFIKAAENNNLNAVNLFIEYFKYNNYINHQTNPLCAAAFKGYYQIVETILDKTTMRGDEFNNTAIVNAAAQGHIETVNVLLNSRYSYVGYNFFESKALISSSENGHIDIVKLLLKQEKSFSCPYHAMSIILASSNNHKNIVKLLWNENFNKEALQKLSPDLYDFLIQMDVRKKIKMF